MRSALRICYQVSRRNARVRLPYRLREKPSRAIPRALRRLGRENKAMMSAIAVVALVGVADTCRSFDCPSWTLTSSTQRYSDSDSIPSTTTEPSIVETRCTCALFFPARAFVPPACRPTRFMFPGVRCSFQGADLCGNSVLVVVRGKGLDVWKVSIIEK